MGIGPDEGSRTSEAACQTDGCHAAAIVRHNGCVYCATHGLAELLRVGVLTLQKKVINPVADALTEPEPEPATQFDIRE
jgi:hypothetical protein